LAHVRQMACDISRPTTCTGQLRGQYFPVFIISPCGGLVSFRTPAVDPLTKKERRNGETKAGWRLCLHGLWLEVQDWNPEPWLFTRHSQGSAHTRLHPPDHAHPDPTLLSSTHPDPTPLSSAHPNSTFLGFCPPWLHPLELPPPQSLPQSPPSHCPVLLGSSLLRAPCPPRDPVLP
jgi:hypothetical protein